MLKALFTAFLTTFLTAFLEPLPRPFLHLFFQHRPHLLQLRRPLQGRLREPPPQQHLSDPLPERPFQSVLARTRHPSQQRIQRTFQLRRCAAVLQQDQRRHQVPARQIVRPVPSNVKHEVPLGWLIPPQRLRPHRRTHLRHLARRRPPRAAAVVEDHRQHRRQLPVRVQLSAPEQVLIQQPGIGQQAHGHGPVHGGLELQRHVQPGLAAAQPPQQVAVAPAQVLADEGGGAVLQRGEVQGIAPRSGDEPAQEVFDHPGMGEQELAGGVLGHARIVSCGCGHRRAASEPVHRAPGRGKT